MTQESTVPSVPAVPVYVAPTAEKKAYLAALALAQAAFEPILRNRSVFIAGKDGKAGYGFKYAELVEILAKTRAACAANGLSLRSRIVPHDSGEYVWVQSILAHAEGYEDLSEMALPIGGDIKQFGGQITYLRRYMAAAQLGVGSDDDEDDNGDGGGEQGQFQRGYSNPPATKRAPPRPAAAPARPAAKAAPAQAPAEPPAGDEPPPPEGFEGGDDTTAKTGVVTSAAPEPEARPTPATPISQGRANWIKNKIDALDLSAEAVAALFAKHGPYSLATVESFPDALFVALKSDLMATK